MYAINLADLAYPERVIVARCLIAPVQGEIVATDAHRFDEMAVTLDCDDERAKAIVDTIRLKFKRNTLRCYRGQLGGAWERV
jgi:hypothetical protein